MSESRHFQFNLLVRVNGEEYIFIALDEVSSEKVTELVNEAHAELVGELASNPAGKGFAQELFGLDDTVQILQDVIQQDPILRQISDPDKLDEVAETTLG